MKTNALLLIALMLFADSGCSRRLDRASTVVSTAEPQVRMQAPAPVADVFKQVPPAAAEAGDGFNGAFVGVKEGKQAKQQLAEAKGVDQRKIKYTADLHLIVEDFAKAQTELIQRVDQHKGFIARSDITTSPGSARVGTWKLRVPVAEFRAFCDEVLQLGEVQKYVTDSEAVVVTEPLSTAKKG